MKSSSNCNSMNHNTNASYSNPSGLSRHESNSSLSSIDSTDSSCSIASITTADMSSRCCLPMPAAPVSPKYRFLQETSPSCKAPRLGRSFSGGWASNLRYPKRSTKKEPLEENKCDDSSPRKSGIFNLSSRQKWTLILLVLSEFCVDCGSTLLEPFFPSAAQRKGASITEVGFIFNCMEMVVMITAPIFGIFLSKIGSRFLLNAGLFLAGATLCLTGTLYAFPDGDIFVVMCFVCRILQALGQSAFATATVAVLCNEFPERRSTAVALIETATGLGYMAGPSLGGLIYDRAGFGAAFWFGGGLCLFVFLLLITLLPPQEPIVLVGEKSVFGLFKSGRVWIGIVIIVTTMTGVGFLDPSLEPHLRQYGLTPTHIGLVFMVQPGIYAITTPIWGYLCDSRQISAPLLIVGNLVSALSFFMIGPVQFVGFIPDELWNILVGVVILGFGTGSTLIPAFSSVSNGADELGFEDNVQTFSMVSGIFLSSFCVGGFIGQTLGGLVVDIYGFQTAAFVVASVYFCGMLLSIAFFSCSRLTRSNKIYRNAPTKTEDISNAYSTYEKNSELWF